MARKRYNEEDILRLLREIEVHLHGGMDVVSACRTAGISDKTYYGWRKRYGVAQSVHNWISFCGGDCGWSLQLRAIWSLLDL